METIYFKGTPCHTYRQPAGCRRKAPCFTLVTPELKEIHCNDFPGKYIVLNIFPSLDTAVCAMSVRKFNEKRQNTPTRLYYACQWTYRSPPNASARQKA